MKLNTLLAQLQSMQKSDENPDVFIFAGRKLFTLVDAEFTSETQKIVFLGGATINEAHTDLREECIRTWL